MKDLRQTLKVVFFSISSSLQAACLLEIVELEHNLVVSHLPEIVYLYIFFLKRIRFRFFFFSCVDVSLSRLSSSLLAILSCWKKVYPDLRKVDLALAR